MTALEIRPEEIGRFDLEAYRALQARLRYNTRAKCVEAKRAQRPKHRLDAFKYRHPIGPVRVIVQRDVICVATVSNPDRIIHEICIQDEVTPLELFSQRRNQNLMLSRMKAYYRLKTETNMSYPAIGRYMGRDHTTVLYGVRRFKKLLADGEVSLSSPAAIAAE